MKRSRCHVSHRTRKSYILLLFVLSCLLQESFQLSITHQRREPKKDASDVIIKHSETCLLVGNLPWNVAAETCQERIECILGLANDSLLTIAMKPVDTTRPRDRNKCHGGSAQVTFASHEEALLGMEALSKDPDLRVRWAIKTPPSPAEQKKLPLDEKTIQRRKERAARYARKRQRIAATTDGIIRRIQQHFISMDEIQLIGDPMPVLETPLLDWTVAPKEMDPMRGGGLSATARGERKRAAVEAFVHVIRQTLFSTGIVADLGCGAGNLSLPLAWWLRHFEQQDNNVASCHVLGVDLNRRSLKRLQDRATAIGLNGSMLIETKQLDMLQLFRGNPLSETFSAVVSLHACGSASDLAIAVAVDNEIPFVVSPCCIGKVNRDRRHADNSSVGMPSLGSAQRSAAPEEITYPRSTWLKEIVNSDEYSLLAAAADYAGSLSDTDNASEADRRQRSRTAKQIVELDRLQWAKEQGYVVRLMELPRIGPLYSKRELLLGAPTESPVANRILQLSHL
jgi:SAM-dependent methyltransferase